MAQNNPSAPPQGSVLLRLLAGGYLVYLAWQLFQGADGDWRLLLAAGIFAVVGAALVVWNGWDPDPQRLLPQHASPGAPPEDTDPEP